MGRRWFYMTSAAVFMAVGLLAYQWSGALYSLILFVPLFVIGLNDCLQHGQTIRRNFPLIGNGRYLLESIRPEIQQYFVENNTDGRPIEREMRSVVYQRAKGVLDTLPFGTQRDVYQVGYEWASHSLAPVHPPEADPRIRVGGPDCSQPYDASLLNISAMSYGSLSHTAVLALSQGAQAGHFAHNTGEGGISPYHLEGGADLVWQIGTGYFGCRDGKGNFDPGAFAERAKQDTVKMIELKLSQGAKPGHGGILPGKKVTPEVARIRHVPVGETVFSPAGHSAFCTPIELVEFIAQLRELSGGKPVGFKLCIGRRTDFMALCKAMLQTGITPDFITIDGGEGGTGAAPLEFSNHLGMPGRDALIFAHGALLGAELRERVKLVASGKILGAFDMIRALAIGADLCASARGMMLALGCIQALRCNNNTCPTGVATQEPHLVAGLHVPTKATRVRQYHASTLHAFKELLGAMGLMHPDQLGPHHIYRRVDDQRVRHLGELYDYVQHGALLGGQDLPEGYQRDWLQADPGTWGDQPEIGLYGGRSRRSRHSSLLPER